MDNRNHSNWCGLVEHLVRTLPESITLRRQLIASLAEVMPRNHPLRNRVTDLLHGLNDHLTHQREIQLSFEFREGSKK